MSIDLSTQYLGFRLRNPLVASASPLTGNVDSLARLEEAGIAAVVLPSLFEEQIEHEEVEIAKLFEYHTESFAESLTHFPEPDHVRTGPSDYLEHVEAAKRTVTVPVIGSLNGVSPGGWTRYAKWIEEAGADALELNIYFIPTNPLITSSDVEQRYVDLVASVTDSVTIPLAVKIGPTFSALPNFFQRLVQAGAKGLVLFNRYLEADIDLDTLQFTPDLVLSNRHEARGPIRWIAVLRDFLPTPKISLAATSGVHRWQGALKLLLAGADVTMMASALLKMGPPLIPRMLRDLQQWIEEHEYTSIEQLKGSMSQRNCPDPSALVRANYMQALKKYTWSPPLGEHR